MALAGLTVLVDPWLEGDLTFGEQAWLYTGKKGRLADVALNLKDIEAQTDVILLSQVSRAAARSHAVQGLHQTQTCQCCLAGLPVKGLGRPLQVHAELRLPGHQHHRGHFLVQGLDDHAHKPTLRKLSKDIPVVGSPAAAAVARQLGFKTVRHCLFLVLVVIPSLNCCQRRSDDKCQCFEHVFLCTTHVPKLFAACAHATALLHRPGQATGQLLQLCSVFTVLCFAVCRNDQATWCNYCHCALSSRLVLCCHNDNDQAT